MLQKKVLIFGGGIAGLTVAHECLALGLEVHLYEQKSWCGGKAFGFQAPDGLHIEHSIRTYSSSYHHLFQTLRQIPVGEGRTVFDNLVALPGILLAAGREAGRSQLLPTALSVSKLRKLRLLLQILRKWGLTPREMARFIGLGLDYALKSEPQRQSAYAAKSFAEYAELATSSPAYRHFLTALLDIIVAAKHYAGANTILPLLNRLLFPPPAAGITSSVNVLNGPTNERFINPWVQHLQNQGLHLHLNSSLEALGNEAGQVTHALVNQVACPADAFVLALPFQQVCCLLPKQRLPTKTHREWSFSYQFYLRDIPPELSQNHTFTLVLDSPWKLIYLVEAPPLWQGVDLRPDVRGILSVTLSNVQEPGLLTGRALPQCTDEEVQAELLHQLGFAHPELLLDARRDLTVAYLPEGEYQQRRTEFIGWDSFPPNAQGYRWLIESTLFVPEATDGPPVGVDTNLPNLFLAGEFVRTTYHLPTMEQANEAGKLCAASIGRYFGRASLKVPPQRPAPPFRHLRWVASQLRRS